MKNERNERKEIMCAPETTPFFVIFFIFKKIVIQFLSKSYNFIDLVTLCQKVMIVLKFDNYNKNTVFMRNLTRSKQFIFKQSHEICGDIWGLKVKIECTNTAILHRSIFQLNEMTLKISDFTTKRCDFGTKSPKTHVKTFQFYDKKL